MSNLTPFTGWSGIGPGLGVEFKASPGEIQSAFETALPKDLAPYEWQLFDPIWSGRRVIGGTCTSIAIHDTAHFLIKKFAETSLSVILHLRSRQLHPEIDWKSCQYPDSFCGLNGMPRLLSPSRDLEGRLRYHFGICWKVGNLERTEIIEHLEYRRIFEALRRQLKKLDRKPTGH